MSSPLIETSRGAAPEGPPTPTSALPRTLGGCRPAGQGRVHRVDRWSIPSGDEGEPGSDQSGDQAQQQPPGERPLAVDEETGRDSEDTDDGRDDVQPDAGIETAVVDE